jgi:hypothetical protein
LDINDDEAENVVPVPVPVPVPDDAFVAATTVDVERLLRIFIAP